MRITSFSRSSLMRIRLAGRNLCHSQRQPIKPLIPLEYAVPEGSTIHLNVTELTNEGIGLGRHSLPDGEKLVVMVPFALPGEEIECRVVKNNKRYWFERISYY